MVYLPVEFFYNSKIIKTRLSCANRKSPGFFESKKRASLKGCDTMKTKFSLILLFFFALSASFANEMVTVLSHDLEKEKTIVIEAQTLKPHDKFAKLYLQVLEGRVAVNLNSASQILMKNDWIEVDSTQALSVKALSEKSKFIIFSLVRK
jgi:hypothetical protein